MMSAMQTEKSKDRSYKFTADFRFYEELNDFFPVAQRKQTLNYRFNGNPGIKDPIEVFGVPHTEVDLIIVNGVSVGFDYQLQANDRVAVYPVFESFDISPIIKLRERPLRSTAFVVDVNLGKLARLLRMLGFDALYSNAYLDREVVEISVREKRIILTRDRRLLYAKCITHGYWVRSDSPQKQIDEILNRFDLDNQVQSFHRCLVCNGVLMPVDKQHVWAQLEPKTRKYYQSFFQCGMCKKVYWEGSHVEKMKQRLKTIIKTAG